MKPWEIACQLRVRDLEWLYELEQRDHAHHEIHRAVDGIAKVPAAELDQLLPNQESQNSDDDDESESDGRYFAADQLPLRGKLVGQPWRRYTASPELNQTEEEPGSRGQSESDLAQDAADIFYAELEERFHWD